MARIYTFAPTNRQQQRRLTAALNTAVRTASAASAAFSDLVSAVGNEGECGAAIIAQAAIDCFIDAQRELRLAAAAPQTCRCSSRSCPLCAPLKAARRTTK